MTLVSPNRGYRLEKIEGDGASMGYWVGVFDRTATRISDVRTGAQTVAELGGEGKGIRARRADAQELVGLAGQDIAEAELLSGVLSAYADAHGAYAVPANRMIDEIEAAHATWERADHAAERAGQNALWKSHSGTHDEIAEASRKAREKIVARDAAGVALEELWEAYERLYSQWDEAYDAAMSALAARTAVVMADGAQELLDSLLAADTPAEVKRLWDAAGQDARDALTEAHPEIIGNLDGVPNEVRAKVNQIRLMKLYAELDTLPEPLKSDVSTLHDEVADHQARLISFDPDGSNQTTAALWYGPFEADKVSVLVPGMMAVVSEMGEWGQSAADLNSAVGGDSATVAWFGYDTPNFAEEPSQMHAKDGAPAFRSFLLGVGAVLPKAELDVVAHSYGSTMAARAIGSQPDGLGVDRFITVGSAGLPDEADILENLQADTAPHIYATGSHDDFWAPVGQLFGSHGKSPEGLDGVTVFDSDGGEITVGGKKHELLPTPGHSAHGGVNFPWEHAPGGYLQKGSEAFYNVGQIVKTGHPGTENGGPGSRPGFWDYVAQGAGSPGMYGY